ncbi:amidase [Arthrobacter sp. SLBN-112]|uniref:amidase n=1 Tax=Arthrobacter sp. SLBN-112 TaxID=2768452 RepID=UPI0013586932|nr:amidase [Arthrobacter sp. SLBN-112]
MPPVIAGAGMETATGLWRMGATQLAQAIRSRRTSSREVIEVHLRRIEAVNPVINAVTILLAEEALDAADAADRLLAAGGELPPLLGVPFTVKGNIDLLHAPTTQGLKVSTDAYPTRDAPTVERLRAAGAIPLGHTNLANLAVRWHCVSEVWGATINPWDRNLTPGASTGGEAAALASGMTPLGIGADGLGSLRWPAQCCGVSALKPTLGRIPNASTVEPAGEPIGAQLLVAVGPMARRVADLRAAFEVTAGPTWRDPWCVPAPLQGPEPDKPVRVALVVDPAARGVAPQVADGLRKAAAALDDAGYSVQEAEPPSIEEAARAALAMLNTPECRAVILPMLNMLPADTRQFLSAFYGLAGGPDPVAALSAFVTRQTVLRAWGEFQETHSLILAPISTDIPFKADDSDLDHDQVARTIRNLRMTLAVNALGLPAVAVPVGVAGGLPQVIQLIGPRYREDLCLDAAAALEERLGIFTPIDPRKDRIQQ